MRGCARVSLGRARVLKGQGRPCEGVRASQPGPCARVRKGLPEPWACERAQGSARALRGPHRVREGHYSAGQGLARMRRAQLVAL